MTKESLILQFSLLCNDQNNFVAPAVEKLNENIFDVFINKGLHMPLFEVVRVGKKKIKYIRGTHFIMFDIAPEEFEQMKKIYNEKFAEFFPELKNT